MVNERTANSDPFSSLGDLGDAIKAGYEQFNREAGRFNLAVFGKTGVGKSTLVNTVFGRDVAPTGTGRPVTADGKMYFHPNGLLGLYDTVGLEVGQHSSEILGALQQFSAEDSTRPWHEQIHLIWYCVRMPDRRWEPFESDFVRALNRLGFKVICVLLQVPNVDGDPTPEAAELVDAINAERLPLATDPILVKAKEDRFTGPVFGLDVLMERSIEIMPEKARQAAAAEQVVSQKAKGQSANQIIAIGAAAAAAAGLVPLPGADAVAISAAQVAMMAAVARNYGLSVDRAQMAAMAAVTVATGGGRMLAGMLLKMIPGVGTLAGGAINAAVASSITGAIGFAWKGLCAHWAGSGQAQLPNTDEMRRQFERAFREQWARRKDVDAELEQIEASSAVRF